MAIASELKIYKDMYKLMHLILDAREVFPKSYKYAFGEHLMMLSLECCELIQAANMSIDTRMVYLNEFAVKFGSLQLALRVCRDRKIISQNKFSDIVLLCGEIGKQSSGWRRATISQSSVSSTEGRSEQ